MAANFLQLNSDKTQMLVLGPKKQRDLLLNLTINLDGCTADFKVLLLTYKALHGLAPTYLSRISKQTAGGRAFSYRAPFLWNGLPTHVREADSVSTFKSLLRTHLFSGSYH